MLNSQLNILKSRTKNSTEGDLNVSSNMVGDPNDKTNFNNPPNNETKDIIKANRSLENRKILLKTTTSKISPKGGLLNFLAPLMKVG